MTLSLFYLLITLASLYGLMILVKKYLVLSNDQIPFVTMSALMSALYVGAVFGFLLEFSLVIFSSGIIIFLGSAYKILRERKKWYDPSWFAFSLFGILFLLNWILFRDYYLIRWDEFSFWGYFSKILVECHDIIANFNSINKADYPRGSAILHYYFILFINQGNFHEGTAIFAQASVLLSALPIFLPDRKKYNIFFLTTIYLCFCASFYVFTTPIYSIYNDSILGLFWALAIILYLKNKNKEKAIPAIGIVLFCIVQIKQIGIVFGFFAIFIFSIDYLFFTHQKNALIKLRNIGFLVMIMFFSKISWDTYKYYHDVQISTFRFDLSKTHFFPQNDNLKKISKSYFYSLMYIGDITESVKALNEKDEDRYIAKFGTPIHLEDKVNALNKLFNEKWSVKSKVKIWLSPFYWTIIFMFFSLLLYYLKKKHIEEEILTSKKRYFVFLCSILIALIGYLYLMLLLYMNNFGFVEAISLTSFDRYLGTFYIGIFFVLFYMTLRLENKTLTICFVTLIFLFTPGTLIETFAPRNTLPVYPYLDNMHKRIDPVIKTIQRENKEAGIYFINQGGSGTSLVKIKYMMFPLNFIFFPWSISTVKKENQRPSTRIVSVEKFAKYLQKCDYLIVWGNRGFWEQYGEAVKKADLKGIWVLKGESLERMKI